ncbi:M16 family metallopeptidase [Enemella sp. A6]|uniref:M16 family metallopeptidase n=1 Tax=Enemella sp. A6 TaxID=3440152 RepID=UPI003EC0FC16
MGRMPDLHYPLHTTTLANGLRVVVNPDHAVPSAAMNIWYNVGSRHEQPGLTGFAHLFEHLMFQGSAHVGSGEHISLLQANGASVNATTWFDRTNYFAALPIGGLELALWLEADRLESLLTALTQENLDNQREVVKEEKRQRYDNVPYGDLMDTLVGLVFPADHPYGHTTIGSMDDLNAASLEDAHTFFRTHYMPNNAVLSLVGDLTADEGFALAEKYFGHIPAGELPPVVMPDPLPALTGLPSADVRADVPADAVYLAWRLPAMDDPAFDATDLALMVLGDGQPSRLHRTLVRDNPLASSAGAGSIGLIGGTSLGFISARAIEGHSIDEVTDRTLAELDRLVTDGPEEAELDRVKAQYERAWLQGLARLDARADQLSGTTLLRGDHEFINRHLGEVMAIDAEAVTEAARRHLNPEHRATVTYRKEQA